MANYHLAIDTGASSGRHILGRLDGGRLILEEIHCFENGQLRRDGRTLGIPALVEKIVSPEELYTRTGIQRHHQRTCKRRSQNLGSGPDSPPGLS